MKKNVIIAVLLFVFFSCSFASAEVFDGVKIGDPPVVLEDYGTIQLAAFSFDGNTAQLQAKIINERQQPFDFAKNISVKVIYTGRKNKEYPFIGKTYTWGYRQWKDYFGDTKSATDYNLGTYLLSPMDEKYYRFDCTLTAPIVRDKTSPLKMYIKLGDNEIIYNINPRENPKE